MTLEFRCSNCGTLLETSNADALSEQMDALVEALKEIEELGANGVTAARLGNIAHAAIIALRDPVGQRNSHD